MSATSGASIGRRAVLAGLALAPAILRAAEPEIFTSLGAVRGTLEGGVRVFRGIRYGAAPRFGPPAAPSPVREVIAADRFGPTCPQRGDRYRTVDEDCLYLNVWTPEASPRRRRPVMVYIHGGAYSSGSAVDPLLDGTRLALNEVVVVTIQHRLNAFGYLYLARLDPRFEDSGNAGQLDLILALRWIRENIANFGGDPGRVMVFGQSGGGAKIATMMGMPAAAGLFHRAATMSGQQVTVSGPQNATARARAYLAALRVDLPAGLRALSTEALVNGLAETDPILGGGLYFGPVLDMKWLTRHPFWPDANPQSNAVPLMLGNTHDETRAFYPQDHPKLAGLSWDNIGERIGPELRVDGHPEWVVAEYRRLFPAYTPEQIFYAATTAGRSWRAQIVEAEERARAGAPAYVYQLDFPSPASHGADIPLVFGGIGPVANAFLRFARTGHPGWAPYTLQARRTMIFGRTPHLVSNPRRAERELFARIPYVQPGT